MINAAIVGLGRWGQNLVNSVHGKSEKIRFTAGVLRHPEKARSYASERGLTLHSSLDAVLRDAAIDAIVLATPHSVHAEQIMAAVNAGKPVFTEKPFTLDAPSASQVLRAAAEANVTVALGSFNEDKLSHDAAAALAVWLYITAASRTAQSPPTRIFIASISSTRIHVHAGIG